MKTPFTFAALLLSLFLMAQKPLTYTQVIAADSIPQDVLFARAKKWLSLQAIGSKGALANADKETGEISAKLSIPYTSAYREFQRETQGRIWFTLTIYCKPGRYKYEFTNFTHEGSAGEDMTGMVLAGVPLTYNEISFGQITTDSICPPQIATDHGRKWGTKMWVEMKQECRAVVVPLISKLDIEMQKPITETNDNW